MKKSTHQIGKENETKACNYLVKEGYTILDRNFQTRFGEIDIICSKESTIHVIEVKTLQTDWAESDITFLVNAFKQYKIKNVFTYYLATNNLITYDNIKFDVISVMNNKIKHYVGAF